MWVWQRVRSLLLYTHNPDTAYVLDLRCKFPAACEPVYPGDVTWRERAIGLERDLACLQKQYDEERISECMVDSTYCTFSIELPRRMVISANCWRDYTSGVPIHHPSCEDSQKETLHKKFRVK